MTKKELLDSIKQYYLCSDDFNGLPIYEIEEYNEQDIIDLIKEGLIESISVNDVLNPHIKGFDLELTIEHQIEELINKEEHICLYPTELALVDLIPNQTMPYKALLEKGKAQFDIVFFDIEILQNYMNNPKFTILDSGYLGTIIPNDCNCDEIEIETYGYVKHFGMAYKKNTDKIIRAIAVFIRDLYRLSPEIQLRWKSYELKNQDQYTVARSYITNLIFGEFSDEHWIFDAILDEMCVINDMCSAIGIPALFNHTYGTSSYEKPEGYCNILLPTRKNFFDFVLVLEKMFIHNINYNTFQSSAGHVKPIARRDEKGELKRSIQMLQEWLHKNVKTNFDIDTVIIDPLKEIRKIRQTPAHVLYKNEYDTGFFEEQKTIVEKLYDSLYALRLALGGHPYAKKVKIPKYLIEGKNIVFH